MNDQETQKIISEGSLIHSMVNTDGWRLAKERLTEKLMDLQSIRNLPKEGSATAREKEIAIRLGICDIILEWVGDIEGISEQYVGNLPAKAENSGDPIIRINQ